MTLFLIATCLTPNAIGAGLTQQDLREAVAYGRKFKTVDKFLQHGMKGIRVRLASAMAMDGISKFATFYNEWNYVAALAAQAAQQMRDIDPATIRLDGNVHCFVEIHALGSIPTSKMNRRYAGERAHMVLSIGDRTIQPLAREMLAKSDQSPGAIVIGLQTGKITLQFEFPPDHALEREVEVVLIDGDGNKHRSIADLSSLIVVPHAEVSQ